MSIKQQRFFLTLCSIGLILGGVALPVWAILSPVKIPVMRESASTKNRPDKVSTETARLLPLTQLEALWNLPLQGPLFDPPVSENIEVPVAPVQPNLPLRLKLLGTMIEANRPVAMFVLASGRIVTRGVGQTIDDRPASPQIVEIENNQAILLYQGEEISLELERSAP